jgi:hypothetical protein
MTMALSMPAVATLALVLAPAASGRAAPLEIRHQPLSCMPLYRYARVTAEAVPAEGLARAEIQFRTGPAAAWYSIQMTALGASWSALLPSALPSLPGFEYRIVITSRTLAVSATPAFAVRVEASSEACAAATEDALDSAIVVRIPPGAPIVPPVPAGFSPTGVVAAQAAPRTPSKMPLVLAGGVVAVGGAAGLLAASGGAAKPPEPPLDIPEFRFSGTIPSPGAVLSLSHTELVVLVAMSREPRSPLDLGWGLYLSTDAARPACVHMEGTFSGAQRPLGLALTAPLLPTGACGVPFDVALGRLTIDVGDTLVYDTTQALPFHVEP